MRVLLISIILILPVYTHFVHRNLSLSQFRIGRGWVFLEKMRFNSGEAKINFDAKYQSSRQIKQDHQITFEIVEQEDWQQSINFKCFKNNSKDDQSRFTHSQVINFSKELNYVGKFQKIIKLEEQKTIYFVLKDCPFLLINNYFHPDNQIQLSIQLYNNGGTLSADQKKAIVLLPLLIIFNLYTLKILFAKYKQKEYLKTIIGSLIFAQIFNFLNFSANLANHLHIYFKGSSSFLLKYQHLVLHAFSESIFCTILILLVLGMTIRNKEFMNYWLATIFAIIWIFLTLLSQIIQEDIHKYHKFDGFIASLLNICRLILTSFLVICSMIQIFRAKSDKHKRFYMHLFWIGATYLGFIPLVTILSNSIDLSKRNAFVFLSTEMIMNVSIGLIIGSIVKKGSSYQQIAHQNQSFMQS